MIDDDISLPLSSFFSGEYTWQAGPSNPIDLAPELLALVAARIATPGFIVSEEISIEEAPEAYARFEARNTTKVVIKFD